MRQEDEERAQILKKDGLLIGIAGVSLLNGMHFSPLFDPAFFLLKGFAPRFLTASPLLLFYFTSLILATVTLILAGVPAALFERLTRRAESDAISLAIWLAGAALLALPAFFGFAGFLK